jgi:hypothetical protein
MGALSQALKALAASTPFPAIPAGSWVARWRIDGPFSAGGEAAIYVAGQFVLKVAHGGRCLDAEAEVLARAANPRLVRLIDRGTHDGLAFLVLERLRPTRAALDAALRREARAGLEAIHAAGCVHGDVKRDNLVIQADGRVVWIDPGRRGAPEADLAALERL